MVKLNSKIRQRKHKRGSLISREEPMKKSMSPKTHGKILIYIYILQVESDNFGGLEENKNYTLRGIIYLNIV